MIAALLGYFAYLLYEKRQMQKMHEAYDRYWDALDRAAMNMDTKEYDRIKSIGWRKFGVDAA